MFSLNRLSLKAKLQLPILIASLGSITAISYLGWAKTRLESPIAGSPSQTEK
jgi:hypothetical protein